MESQSSCLDMIWTTQGLVTRIIQASVRCQGAVKGPRTQQVGSQSNREWTLMGSLGIKNKTYWIRTISNFLCKQILEGTQETWVATLKRSKTSPQLTETTFRANPTLSWRLLISLNTTTKFTNISKTLSWASSLTRMPMASTSNRAFKVRANSVWPNLTRLRPTTF